MDKDRAKSGKIADLGLLTLLVPHILTFLSSAVSMSLLYRFAVFFPIF